MEGPHRLSSTLQPHFTFQHGNVFIASVDYKSHTCLWYKSHKKDMEVSCCSHSRDKDVLSFLYQSTGSEKHNDHSECFSWRQICLWGPMETLSQLAPFTERTPGVFCPKRQLIEESCCLLPWISWIYPRILPHWGSLLPKWQGNGGSGQQQSVNLQG